ncbi:hypothetical protein F11_16800 [Rhodospirillum rubrum F11]|uniref:accessory factor UbiK family protein n=1 Tax=Rhodospirillum rubrum TaxID=1085 RepID=UPI000229D450|nr:accessory factor UbiK family protein [Rhodospirillum rubrum]AEO49820.1 hypothetical protein F11_16800 [Rhodospirillum rubrum F11]
MKAGNRLMDDFSRVAGGALGALGGLRGEIEVIVRQRLEKLISSMDLVTREEFDAVAAVAREARQRQEDLEKQVATLESRLTDQIKTAIAETAQAATPAPTARRAGPKGTGPHGEATDKPSDL